MTEMNIEVDKDDNRIGMRPRDDFYTGKYIHRASHLLLFNSKNEVLLQKRAPDKRWFPDLYTASASGTVADESYEECMIKETKEEIGLCIPVKLVFKFPFFHEQDKAWHAVFIGKSDDEITPDEREIAAIKWMPIAELKQDIVTNPEKYTPPFRDCMRIFFEKGLDKDI